MRKRIRAGFLLSAVLPVLAVSVWMLRIAGPSSRWVAIGVYGLGLAAFVFAVRKHDTSRDRAARGGLAVGSWLGANVGPLLTIGIFIVAGWAITVLVPPGTGKMDEPAPDLANRLDRDARRLELSAPALTSVVDKGRELFGSAESAVDPDKKALLVRTWASFLDHSIALDRLVETHQYFYRISPIHHLDLNVRSFLIGYSALVAELAGTARLVGAVGGVRDVESVLDEARPELGVTAGSYYRLKQSLIAPDTALRFHAGRAHLEILQKAGRFNRSDDLSLIERTRAAYADVSERVVKGPDILVDNPADFLEKKAFVAWFPMQKNVSEAMGDIRTTERAPFVNPESIRELGAKLEPGDVFLERRNWYLSNIGLPGFWPHAALFVGTLDEQDRYFEGDARKATQGEAPSAYVARVFPAVQSAFAASTGHDPPRIIEAVSEGVTLTSIEHSAGADYVTVLRPRLPKEEKLAAIVRAYGYFGRPYDFDFDFVTDNAIVCSELVYKAYRTREGSTGLRFDLTRTADRWVLPPNDIIRKFDEEFGTPKADLEFVAFLDGSEHDHKAVSRDALALRESWRRPKWDILQK